MRMGKLLRVLTISVATVSALSAVNAQANLMLLAQDPSFETTISSNTWGYNPTTWFAGQFFGGGAWEVVSGSIDIANQPGVAPNGDQFIDLNGNEPCAIRQLMNLNAGVYSLQFWMGAYLADPNHNTSGVPVGEQVGMWVQVTDTSNNLIWQQQAVWTYTNRACRVYELPPSFRFPPLREGNREGRAYSVPPASRGNRTRVRFPSRSGGNLRRGAIVNSARAIGIRGIFALVFQHPPS